MLMSTMSAMHTHMGSTYFTNPSCCAVAAKQLWTEPLTLKTGVPKRFPTETFVILHSIDDDWPTKYVCKNKNVGLFQAGSRL